MTNEIKSLASRPSLGASYSGDTDVFSAQNYYAMYSPFTEARPGDTIILSLRILNAASSVMNDLDISGEYEDGWWPRTYIDPGVTDEIRFKYTLTQEHFDAGVAVAETTVTATVDGEEKSLIATLAFGVGEAALNVVLDSYDQYGAQVYPNPMTYTVKKDGELFDTATFEPGASIFITKPGAYEFIQTEAVAPWRVSDEILTVTVNAGDRNYIYVRSTVERIPAPTAFMAYAGPWATDVGDNAVYEIYFSNTENLKWTAVSFDTAGMVRISEQKNAAGYLEYVTYQLRFKITEDDFPNYAARTVSGAYTLNGVKMPFTVSASAAIGRAQVGFIISPVTTTGRKPASFYFEMTSENGERAEGYWPWARAVQHGKHYFRLTEVSEGFEVTDTVVTYDIKLREERENVLIEIPVNDLADPTPDPEPVGDSDELEDMLLTYQQSGTSWLYPF